MKKQALTETDETYLELFEELRGLLVPYCTHLNVIEAETHYSLNCKKEVKKGMPMFFGSVTIMKNYVSYHLMPVYADPSLLQNISPELKKRMQGKSCFNFKKAEPALFRELKALTKKGYQSFVKAGWIEKEKSR
ncbi:MAG: hypothetical protein JNL72_04165 [Flavipsychrobacter sp.]|nr:hypothetical protein [Flavipsychrobacter sp.]